MKITGFLKFLNPNRNLKLINQVQAERYRKYELNCLDQANFRRIMFVLFHIFIQQIENEFISDEGMKSSLSCSLIKHRTFLQNILKTYFKILFNFQNKFQKMFLPSPCFSYYQVQFPCQQYAFFYLPSENQPEQKIIDCKNSVGRNQVRKEISRTEMQFALEKRHKKSKSKFWTQEEDILLLKLAENKSNWGEIAKSFCGKNIEICKRRHERLIRQNDKWPKQNQSLIKHLYQAQKLQWKEIQKILPMYTKKQIKQRYKNFLEVEGIRAEWTVQQDLRLWEMVKAYGNRWVKFTKIFQGRTQLQLKNRYNKFIKPTQERLISRNVKAQMSNQEDDSSS